MASSAEGAIPRIDSSELRRTVLLERINLWWPRALLIAPGRAAARFYARTYCLRGWASRITRFSGLSWPSAYSGTPAVIQGC